MLPGAAVLRQPLMAKVAQVLLIASIADGSSGAGGS
jgi:hypothetical protein